MRVLYLEDDAIDAEAFKRAFARRLPGAGVEVCASPKKALERLAELAPDQMFEIVVVDVSLPEMNGFEFIDRARQLVDAACQPSFVLFTSSEHRIDLAEAKRTEAHAYVVKTADPSCFADLIGALDRLHKAAEAQPTPATTA